MANEEYLAKLKEGPKVWNEWRAQRDATEPGCKFDLSWAKLAEANLAGAVLTEANLLGADLTGAELVGAEFTAAMLNGAKLGMASGDGAVLAKAELVAADLSLANLHGANLTKANLSGADLTKANLTEANLAGANLHRAILAGAGLSGADLNGVTLSWANLSGVNFLAADLTGAELRGANLTGAKLVGAVLAKANLSEANLATADLRRADLAGTVLSRANLTDADLTDVTGLELDSTRILHARFSPRANDKWSILRRTYTGPNMVLNLIFVLLFFAPLIIKGGTLAILANAQHRIESVKGVEHSFSLSTNCKEPQGIISATVDSVEIFHVPCRAEPVWKLLLGSGGPFGVFMPALTAVLIAYQIVRFLLTRQISLMRDAEERSGVSPPKEGIFAYPRLFRVHQALSFVFLIAVVAFALRGYEFLFLDVIFIGGGR